MLCIGRDGDSLCTKASVTMCDKSSSLYFVMDDAEVMGIGVNIYLCTGHCSEILNRIESVLFRDSRLCTTAFSDTVEHTGIKGKYSTNYTYIFSSDRSPKTRMFAC